MSAKGLSGPWFPLESLRSQIHCYQVKSLERLSVAFECNLCPAFPLYAVENSHEDA